MRKRERVSDYFRPILRDRARTLRKEMTPAEVILWSRIKSDQLDGLRFRRQKVIGPYVTDFTCPSLNLVVEVDGDTHADPQQIRKDAERTDYFSGFGLRVARFTNAEVLTNIDGVLLELQRLARELRADPSPPPSPQSTGAREDGPRLNEAAGDEA
jgi:very-short-patch-repair endonuclease